MRQTSGRPYQRGRHNTQAPQPTLPAVRYSSKDDVKRFIDKLHGLRECASHVQMDRLEGVVLQSVSEQILTVWGFFWLQLEYVLPAMSCTSFARIEIVQ